MDTLLQIGQLLIANGPELIAGATLVVSGVIAVAMVFPGDQPEKFLGSALELLKKFSKK